MPPSCRNCRGSYARCSVRPTVVAVQEVYTQTALENPATRITTDDSNVTYTAYVKAIGDSQSAGFLVRSGVAANQVTEHGASEIFIDP